MMQWPGSLLCHNCISGVTLLRQTSRKNTHLKRKQVDLFFPVGEEQSC